MLLTGSDMLAPSTGLHEIHVVVVAASLRSRSIVEMTSATVCDVVH